MTMELIEAYEVPTDTTSVTLDNIPQTFTDLMILVSGRTNRDERVDQIIARPNGSSADMNSISLQAADTAPASFSFTRATSQATGDTATANTFGSGQFYFSNYTSFANKSISVDSTYENNLAANFQGIASALWADTTAITSFDFLPNNGTNIKAGSTIYIYGIV